MLPVSPERVLPTIQSGLRAFVGMTAWEELARQWVDAPARSEQLGFQPQSVGSHWIRHVQVDVVAINWQTRHILLGECTWTSGPVDRATVAELIEQKTPRVIAAMQISASDWTLRHAIFTRSGATPAAQELLAQHQGLLIDLERIYQDAASLRQTGLWCLRPSPTTWERRCPVGEPVELELVEGGRG
ncbi:DUF234 domain-containing protein [Candidatus Viridilinea mediisalina]|uniref:DUF234 domain-containing protein n=1 Tax=Candidatus Viridilinea mediisalina TaxID=2024553 RepID=A0A2A6RHC9_9CHLR|nr:DUF234 domain-containing protein [Candidatus Viridilinea mediisalina]PDW02289.1 hypothetical protein CJ255_14770 [Candidatus Viridilinea mediisalina]